MSCYVCFPPSSVLQRGEYSHAGVRCLAVVVLQNEAVDREIVWGREPHGIDVATGSAADTVQKIGAAGIRCRHHGPGGAVEMLRECRDVVHVGVPDRPQVGG